MSIRGGPPAEGILIGVPLVVMVSSFIGLGVANDPALFVPLSLEIMLLLTATWFFVMLERHRETRRWLFRLALSAFVLRMAALLVVHFVLSPYFFAPDALGYERNGALISAWWTQGIDPGPRVLEGDPFSYYYLNAVFIYVLGDSHLAAPVFNLFAGVWTCLLVFHTSRRIFGVAHAKAAAVIVTLFPSMILWSVLNIRDALATMLVTAAVLLATRLHARTSPMTLAALMLVVLALSQLRDYVAFLVTAGLVLGYFLSVRPGKVVSTMTLGLLATVGLAFVLQQVGAFERVVVDDPIQQMSRLRLGLQDGAQSAYGAEFDTSTLGGALRFLPLGIAFLLFAPFPWAIESPLQMAALPETLLWYPLFGMALIGMRRALREARGWIPFAVLVVLASTYALVEGNFGTAYRHRAQFMPLFFLFAGPGLNAIRSRFELPSLRRKTRMRDATRARARGATDAPPRPGAPLGRRPGRPPG